MALISTKPVRIQTDEGADEWIEIKPKLSAADRAMIEDVFIRAAVNEGRTDIDVRLGARKVAILKAAIVNWHQRDGDNPDVWVPFDKELVGERLDPDDPLAEKVLEEVLKRNPSLALTERN